MAIALDSTSTGQAAGASSLTISHTVGSGSNRALVVIVHTIGGDLMSSGSVTYNGTSMGSPVLAAASANTYAYVLVAPASGTANIVITFNAGGTYANAVAASFTGVDQSTPVSTTASFTNGFATSPRSLSITIPANGAGIDLIYAASGSTTFTPTESGQTQIGSTMVNTGIWSTTGSRIVGSGSAMSWTFTGGTMEVQQGAVALSPASAGDTTPPVLTSATGSATGPTTATIGATTDEGNGTLYGVVTTSATQPSVAQIKAGQDHAGAAAPWGGSTTVSSTGAKTISATGLTASTTYYGHLVHSDSAGNDSNRISSSSFTTSSIPGLTSNPLKNNTGTLLTNQPFEAYVHNTSTGALVVKKTGLTSHASTAVVTFTDAALTAATAYRVVWRQTSTGAEGLETLTAA